MVRRAPVWGGLAGVALSILSGCGAQDQTSRRSDADGPQDLSSEDARASEPRLVKDSSEQVLSTLVIPFGRGGFKLQDNATGTVTWTVDMEQSETVKAGVAPQKYLRVKGDLVVPMDADNKPYDVGCLFVELKDNVYYREQTWLRLATRDGINGQTYTEVKLPIAVDLGGWTSVPELNDSLTLQTFAGNTLKKFDGTLCFRLDFSNAPAQEYEGELIVQYLRPGVSESPPACDATPLPPACQPREEDDGSSGNTADNSNGTVTPPPPPAPFTCTKDPMVLKGKQTAELTWTAGAHTAIEVKLSTDDAAYKGQLGSIVVNGASSATYTAPDKVPSAVRIIATAYPAGIETMPAFCEVKLAADEAIGIADDGETQGIVGNVFQLPTNTQKLPNLDAMKAVDNVIVGNLDIPERSFSTGFPGVKDLFEWFAIRFKGQLIVPAATTCSFKLTADDGANLYIDGRKIVDNDGVHATASKMGDATLSAGHHDFRVDYFQGPRYHITLQLFWKCGNAGGYTIIPPSAFVRPLQ